MSKPAATSVAAQPATGSTEAPSPAEALVRAFNDLRDELVSTLWYLVGNQEDAQDLAQEAFAKCWRTREQQTEIQNLRAWIFRVGINAAKDLQRSAWHRRVKPLQGAEVMLMGESRSPAQEVEDQETVERLRAALMHLRTEEKEVFLMRQNGDLTYEQIAEVFSRPVGTVKTQMRSALQKLRKILVEPADSPA